jgi:two-component sensor histidine kinase/DNA-binding response OmpR family regulator
MPDKQKILIVDDRKENLVALRQVLSDLDAEIIEATTGNQALTATLDNHFAVAILDVFMPGMDGYELAEHLRGDKKTQLMPIVFVTASSVDEHHLFKGYQAGGVDYIVKPYAPEILLGKVKAFLDMDRDKRELRRHRDHLETLVAQRTAALEERVKELKCLYAISSLFAEPGEHLDNYLQAAVELIPRGWQYPEITCAQIIFDGHEFFSTNFRKTNWRQATDIVLNGKAIGKVEVCYLEERPECDEGPFCKEHRDLIEDIARQISVMIQRKQDEQRIIESLKEKETLLKEIHHRVKNNLQVIQSLMNLQASSLENPALKTLFEEARNRINAMAIIHESLYQSESLSSIGLKSYVTRLTSQLSRMYRGCVAHVTLSINVSDIFIGIDQLVPCGLVLNELISNAYKHAFDRSRSGRIEITAFVHEDNHLEISVSDNGKGLPADFESLKFDSLGMKLIFLLVERQLDGSVNVRQNGGTRFIIRFPLLPKDKSANLSTFRGQ